MDLDGDERVMAVDVPSFRTVVLSGSPREVGRIHGEELRDVIREAMGRWKEALSLESGLTAETYLDRFVEETDFVPAIDRWVPHLLEEVRGIAEGADQRFRDVYAYQLIDEQWIFTGQLRRGSGKSTESPNVHVPGSTSSTARRPAEGGSTNPVPDSRDHCTALGIFGQEGRPPILAQNMDIPKFYDGSQTLLFMSASDSEAEDCVWTVAGVIGAMGVNGHGVGVCCNTVSQLASSRNRLPVAFIVRTILEQPRRWKAVTRVKSFRHASGQNYMIGDPKGVTSLECSAKRFVRFIPMPGRLYHTNHPVVNLDLEPASARTESNAKTGADSASSDSEIRFAAISRALAAAGPDVTVEAVEAILGDPRSSVCVMRDGPKNSFTATSMVAELSVPPVVHLAPGPPASVPYETYALGTQR
jgi:hypothetical protein